MTKKEPTEGGSSHTISRRAYRFVALWVAGLLMLYAMGAYFGAVHLRRYKAEEDQRARQAAIASPTTAPAAAGDSAPPAAKPVDVFVGVWINHVTEFRLKEAAWTADFDIWFRWSGDTVSPGETFVVTNGEVLSREKEESHVTGDLRYERYRMAVRMIKSFDPSRFPFANTALTIQVADRAHDGGQLRYVADEGNEGITPGAVPPFIAVERSFATVTQHARTSRGDPSASTRAEAHSRYAFTMLVQLPSASVYLKLFQALFASVAISLIVFFIKPSHADPRFGLSVGGFFAAVGNNVFVGTELPASTGFTLAAMVNGIGLITIFLTLVQSAMSLYLLDTLGEARLSRFFDKACFAAMLVGYVAVNVTLPIVAAS